MNHTQTIQGWTTHGPQMSQGQTERSQGQECYKKGTRHGKDSKLDRQDRDHKWRIQAHHLDLKRGKNTLTVELQHIYSIIAVHLQHYCSTFTALLHYIYSIIAAHFNSSTITTHFSTVTAYSSTFTAHFSTFQFITSHHHHHFKSEDQGLDFLKEIQTKKLLNKPKMTYSSDAFTRDQ